MVPKALKNILCWADSEFAQKKLKITSKNSEMLNLQKKLGLLGQNLFVILVKLITIIITLKTFCLEQKQGKN